ncbi:hypothetical protein [Sphingosinithalassobacter portus]|uniref:hypothetical protein n=1 Tax=Stakelama portus TaxID=2676234 RepID=UPI001EFCC16F|nr:hypothetical protein [Sphingosinithalassobacter portus]
MRIPAFLSALIAMAIPVPVANASGGGSSGGEGTHFVEMPEIAVPITDSGRVGGELRVRLVLDATDDAAAKNIQEMMPVLRAAAVAASLEFARLYASGMRAVDVAMLDQDLTAALQAADHGVARVLIVRVGAFPG